MYDFQLNENPPVVHDDRSAELISVTGDSEPPPSSRPTALVTMPALLGVVTPPADPESASTSADADEESLTDRLARLQNELDHATREGNLDRVRVFEREIAEVCRANGVAGLVVTMKEQLADSEVAVDEVDEAGEPAATPIAGSPAEGEDALSPEPPSSEPPPSSGRTALVTMPGALGVPMSAAPPAPNTKKESPAKRRARLRGELDAAVIAGKLERVREINAELIKLDARSDRRAERDGSLRLLERDPATGKKWIKEYAYDPRSTEMQALYAERLDPADVLEHGGKLIRNDAGEYGLLGGIIRALIAGAAEAKLLMSPEQLRIMAKHLGWDAIERIHGIGAGYARDAAWICWLWSQATDKPFDIDRVPKRKPLGTMAGWAAKEFGDAFSTALMKLGLLEAPAAAPAAVDTEAVTGDTTGVTNGLNGTGEAASVTSNTAGVTSERQVDRG